MYRRIIVYITAIVRDTRSHCLREIEGVDPMCANIAVDLSWQNDLNRVSKSVRRPSTKACLKEVCRDVRTYTYVRGG